MKGRQNWNGKGIGYFFRYLVTSPSFFVPHFFAPSIQNVNWNALRKLGITAVIFDKDNTITEPYKYSIPPSISSSWKECLDTFKPENVVIFSNSAGSPDDNPENNYPEAQKIEQGLKVPVLRHLEKKPYIGCTSDILNHWNKQNDSLFLPHQVCVIGDRYFTDVLFGNINGCLTIATAPITSHGDPFTVKLIRPFEKLLVNILSLFNRGHKHPHFSRLEGYDDVIFEGEDEKKK
eukprot:TRINITY_DN6849_c0_g1_i1.p1 TRINITY_DN6849_c0_g1~~TRINITY_DN6849_c0_g1_i1.p1  ORF type:complete len:234 (-),score=30.16 TRINITY_DN6849_c0_g1_i1:50-751(-)